MILGRLVVSTFRYLRIRLFEYFLRQFSQRSRILRMGVYERIMNVRKGTLVLDLGGQPMIWDTVAPPLNLTILNLPGIAIADYASHHRIKYIEGDACRIAEF